MLGTLSRRLPVAQKWRSGDLAMFLHVLGQTHRRWCRTLLAKGGYRNREARIAAADLLRDLKDPAALPCLLRVLGDNEVDFHVKNAVAAVGSEAVEPLI